MFDDFKELLSIFNAQNVKYLIVGGYAVSFHAQPRATKDIDLLIKPDADNGKAVYAALAKFGAPLGGLTAEDFVERDKFFRMGRAPFMVDILPEIAGVDFDRAWQRSGGSRNRPANWPHGVFHFQRGFNRGETGGGQAAGYRRCCRASPGIRTGIRKRSRDTKASKNRPGE